MTGREFVEDRGNWLIFEAARWWMDKGRQRAGLVVIVGVSVFCFQIFPPLDLHSCQPHPGIDGWQDTTQRCRPFLRVLDE